MILLKPVMIWFFFIKKLTSYIDDRNFIYFFILLNKYRWIRIKLKQAVSIFNLQNILKSFKNAMEKMKNIIESFYHFFTRGQLTTHSTKISSIIVLCFCVPFELFTNFNLGLGTNCCVNKGIKVNVLMKKKT